MRVACALMFLLCLPSCFVARLAENEPLSQVVIERLKPGESTARDVVETLGAPNDVVQLGRRSAYLYAHRAEKKTGLILILLGLYHEDVRSDRVWLFFDENEMLTHVGSTLASHRVQYGMPWNEVHDPDDAAERDAERREIDEEYHRRKGQ